ncbi:MAG: hypothetical protein Q8K89_08895 [Actinomycetota bacterium]|nr:hypothetical protein [Actinomycetota bacterium]
MAINKKKASPIVKIGIIAVSALIVLSFLPWASLGLLTANSGSGQTGGQLETIAAGYTGSVSAFEQSLASDPTSYTVLVNLGNTYFDWGIEIKQAKIAGADKPVWLSATLYYDRALALQPGDPAVSTDAAIAHYYSGDTAKAIELVEPIMTDAPTFAPAFFNAALFYDTAGLTTEAAAAANTYIALDPSGNSGDPELAKSIAAKGSGVVPTSTP